MLLAATIAPPLTWADEPLTREEADAWLHSITYDELLDFVIRADWVERATPVVVEPDSVAVVEGNDVVTWATEPVRIEVGHLAWAITPPERRYISLIPDPPSRFAPAVIGASAGLAVGVVLTIVIGGAR